MRYVGFATTLAVCVFIFKRLIPSLRTLKMTLTIAPKKKLSSCRVGLVRSGVLFGVGVVAGAVLTGFVAHPPLTSGDWASWAQALGATIAIGIAIWVPREQRKYEMAHAIEAHAREEYRLICNALMIAKDAILALQGAQTYIARYDPEFQFDHSTERLETVQMLLMDAAKSAVTPEILESILRLNRQITMTIRDVRLRHDDEDRKVTDTTKNNMERRMARAKESRQFIRDQAKISKETLGKLSTLD
jgi:hypothetical protein